MTFVKGCAILLGCVLGFTAAWVALSLALYEYYPSTYFHYFGDGCQTPDPEHIGASYGFVQGLLVGVALVVILARYSSRHHGNISEGQVPSAEGRLDRFTSLPDWSRRSAPILPDDCQTDRTTPPSGDSDKAIPSQDAIRKTLASDWPSEVATARGLLFSPPVNGNPARRE